ncbi:TadE/TadG family type IV pilus assembly protein [Mesorhizobium xinjiangense]|uniref:TadE/TadG family type IV pilus assembly protein n=1 Tax=Mesorhizobium xinjiangense TaxID=2678685 RepID=UPI0012EEC216|nr:TadE/TadG family type IV pilus assembly protein [Mesorhizobium xinjiangense]
MASKNTGIEEAAGGRHRRRRGFLRNRDGVVAIEFAVLVLPFSLLIFAVLESCISFVGQQILTNATDEVARFVRTGQVRAEDLDQDVLEKLICDRLDLLVASGCDGLDVDLRTHASYAAAAATGYKIDNGEIVLTINGNVDPEGFKVEAGDSEDRNMLRVFYRWPVMTDFLRETMSNLSDGKTLHFATVTWKNERFEN